ncbi:MAG: glutamine amidotransferase [Methanobrevibacter sp.]|nr:glutamine amidotransferase [Methanobrevibacter sp.]
MCGIAGIVYKDKKLHNIGEGITNMLEAIQHRGPDSAGFAIYGGLNLNNEFLFNIQVNNENVIPKIQNLINTKSHIKKGEVIHSVNNSLIYQCIIELKDYSKLNPLIREINAFNNVIVLNASQSFEMIKDIGAVEKIAMHYNTKHKRGTHAIGHTRFSTESNVDIYHAHPFQTYILKDITVVHNGQITNYWKIRDKLERQGHTFETNNDTECLVHYIANKLHKGYSLEESLEKSIKDLDGPFSYIIGTKNGIGIAKDRLGLRPGVIAENDNIFAIASEEVSLQKVANTKYIEKISPGDVRVYEI